MSIFEHKNSLRTIEAQIVQKLKNNEARPKFTGSDKKKKRVLVWSLWRQVETKLFVVCMWRHNPYPS